jgi:hypothetical protein
MIKNSVAGGFDHFTSVAGPDGAQGDAVRSKIDNVEPVAAVRSEADTWRTALHEAGHCVVGRVLGEEVGGCTIVPGADYGGLRWGPKGNSARLSSVDEEPDLCEKIGALMPSPGESRSDVAEILAHVHVRVVDLCAGTAAETLLHPDCEPWMAQSDIRQARLLASLICSSEPAIDAYLLFGLAEGKALIVQHRAAVLAIANALMVHRTLDAIMIDDIIAAAPERARRAAFGRLSRKTRLVLSPTDRKADERNGGPCRRRGYRFRYGGQKRACRSWAGFTEPSSLSPASRLLRGVRSQAIKESRPCVAMFPSPFWQLFPP